VQFQAGVPKMSETIKYIKHKWRNNLKLYSNCIHCGKDRNTFINEQSDINGKLLLGMISIDVFNSEIKKIEKCLTVDEAEIKDILT
jgi:hypothetical protein